MTRPFLLILQGTALQLQGIVLPFLLMLQGRSLTAIAWQVEDREHAALHVSRGAVPESVMALANSLCQSATQYVFGMTFQVWLPTHAWFQPPSPTAQPFSPPLQPLRQHLPVPQKLHFPDFLPHWPQQPLPMFLTPVSRAT